MKWVTLIVSVNAKSSSRIQCADSLARIKPGKASRIIKPFSVKLGESVIISCRVSGHVQDWRGNLEDQENNLRRIVESQGGIVADVVKYRGSGKDGSFLYRIKEAAERTKTHKVLAESTDRYGRHQHYSKTKQNLRMSAHDLDILKMDKENLFLMTFIDPDAELSVVRSLNTKRGQEFKGKKGGRTRKEWMLEVAQEMRGQGYSLRVIAEKLSVSKSTADRWCKIPNLTELIIPILTVHLLSKRTENDRNSREVQQNKRNPR